ncbi:Mu transposase C-terminal domain-containing protein [Paenibacillus glycinis]|uniref:DDE-type integrase/transposase/recombinase n=1 Tax=Paenibacillus glycinis TaxID=2697035 RepID=A0ABW9XSB1_9BACL|nr:Mu transposase C-terminal domain-containing protein [Paenibacillus glycinis]NBD25547.1 DDE-type integrase/transposase/recombinase [Paenibacillus glycinis]
MSLFVNNVLKRNSDESGRLESERILWIDRAQNCAITISIIDKSALPQEKMLSELETDVAEGRLLKLPYDPYAKFMVTDDKLSEKEKEIRDNAWLAISDIVDLEPNIYDKSERYQIIKDVCTRKNKGKKLIYKYLRYYWMGGKKENALLPRFRNCGGPSKKKNPRMKMGRKRRLATEDPLLNGVIVNEETRKIFDEFTTKVYLKVNRRDSVKYTYILMLKERYGIDTKMEHGVEVPVIPESHEVPSIAQLRYYIRTKYTRRKRLVSREGQVTFDRDLRPLLGSETRKASGPGQIFEIDATVADVYLVSMDDINQIIGRPVVYIVVDVWTHMVVGMYVGFEGPSWQGIMMAIENTSVDKVEYCSQFDLDILKGEWPCHHMPQYFYADRGEMESKYADSLGKALGIKLKNAPPYRADLKGIVEQQFRTLNLTLQPWTPGAVKKEYVKRGGPDYVLDAKLTIKDFTRMVIEVILHRNNFHYMEHYPLDKALSRDQVKPIARELWNWGIAHDHFLQEVDPDIVRLNVLPDTEVTASAQGIYFEGMYFGSKELESQGWFVQGKSIKAVIAYDRRCMNHVYVKVDNGRDFIKCWLLEKSSRFLDLSLEEVKMKRYEERLAKDRYESTILQQEVSLAARLEAVKQKAEERVEEQRDASLTKTERKANIRANQKDERDKLRKEQSYELDKPVDDDVREIGDEEPNLDNVIKYKPRSKLDMLSKVKKG